MVTSGLRSLFTLGAHTDGLSERAQSGSVGAHRVGGEMMVQSRAPEVTEWQISWHIDRVSFSCSTAALTYADIG
jgi:hypothetical protein